MQMICEHIHVTIVCQCMEATAEGRKWDKKGTSERQWSDLRSIGSDIRGCMTERQPKKYIKQHISHPQVETGRWSSQCQAAWCQLIWWDAAAAVREELQKHTADLEAVWNSTMRNKIEIFEKKKNSGGPFSWGLQFLYIAYSTQCQEYPHCIQKFCFIHK